MFDQWYCPILLCVLCSAVVYPERCPSYCTQSGELRSAQDCGPSGFCCGWNDNIYCCVHYFDRVNVSSNVNLTTEVCADMMSGRGGSPPRTQSQVLLVCLSTAFWTLSFVAHLK